MDFNIRHALLIAIGLNRNSRELIDKIYSENEQLYYSIYIKSDFFNDCLKNLFTTKTQESINKLIGIVEHCYNENNFTKIESLIKTVHPSILKYIKTANNVNIDVFRDKYLKDKIDDLSEVEIFNIIICLIYSGILYNKDVIGSSTTELAFRYWKKLKDVLYFNANRFKLSKTKQEECRKEFEEIYAMFNLQPFEQIKENNISVFLENFIEKNVAEKCTENMMIEEYLEIRSESFANGIIKYIGSFSRLLNTLGLDDMDSSVNIEFNNEIFDLIITDYVNGKYGNNLSETDKGLYIIACIYIYNLVELYKESQELYLNKSKEEKYRELSKYEEKLTNEKKLLESKENTYKKELSNKNNEIKKLKDRIKELEKALNKEHGANLKVNKIIEEKDDEINKLKEENNILISSLTEVDNFKNHNPISTEDMIEHIDKFKIGVFGGNKRIKGLSEALKNVTYYDSLKQDIASIQNLDYIFINTDFFNHAFFNKVVSYKNKYNIPLGYIGGTNKDLILNQMYKYLR